ncbi:MAG TPA: leucyl/phenylalanyl-tRNA--protein transferase [Flavobacteriales bacterium]|nr:leucyl/phenylalanyl-tRNA--protein transferase [Flavobacteriales bacterium]
MKPPASAPELTPELLLAAYSNGIFPMVGEGSVLEWHKPDPRAVFDLDCIPVPDRATRRLIGQATVAVDTAFEEVMRRCADREKTWIDERMVAAYTQLHRQGHAHSVEVWLNEELVGGIYGVSLGAAYFGESLFGTNNAGKAAFFALVARLREAGCLVFDTQYINDFTRSLGATEIPAAEFDRRLRHALNHEAPFPCA